MRHPLACRLPAIPAALVTMTLLSATAAHAQALGSQQINAVTRPVVQGNPVPVPRANLPPGLPGAASHGSNTPERGPLTGDVDPTEALFDAVNRGDMTTARDALSRGADLNGRNILGLTPIELSIDLGRNDITFLLLSMRGAVASSAPASPEKSGKPPAKVAAARPVLRASASAPVQAQPQRKPQQFVSGNPGTPIPQAGFLGFAGPQQ
jgi:hypothetical protein